MRVALQYNHIRIMEHEAVYCLFSYLSKVDRLLTIEQRGQGEVMLVESGSTNKSDV
jgi:hypothetical protein